MRLLRCRTSLNWMRPTPRDASKSLVTLPAYGQVAAPQPRQTRVNDGSMLASCPLARPPWGSAA